MFVDRYLVTFFRWRAGEPHVGREIMRAEPASPVAACDCAACDRPLADQLPVRLLVLGPGDPDAEADARRGGWYMATAIAVHGSCVGEKLGGREVAAPFGTVDDVIDLLRHLGRPVS